MNTTSAKPELQIEFAEFQRVDVRVGIVREVEEAAGLRVSAYKLTIDFGGEIGTKISLAQATHYSKEELLGRQVLAVVNLKPRQMGKYISEVLALGVPDTDGRVVLIQPDEEVPIGGRLY